MGKKIRTKKEKALIASGVSLGIIGLLVGGALVALKCISKSLEGFTIEDDEEMSGGFYVVKTKETYVFEDEADADVKVDAARRDPGFAGVEKKYKAGKMNKAGDVVRPETWTVVVKLNK